MTSDEFINTAIDCGQRNGVASLDPIQRMVFLIAEAEADCDMNGIDTFIKRYTPDWIAETAMAYEAVGATEIAAEFRTVPVDAPVGDPRMARLNELISSRIGYDYDAIRQAVDERRRTASFLHAKVSE